MPVRRLLAALLLLGAASCRCGPEVIYLTSFEGVPASQLTAVRRLLADFYQRPVHLLPTQRHRAASLCPVRHRHRAAAVLAQLQQLLPGRTDGKILALTTQDVEIENGPRQPHWGVMGLANAIGGDACIVSTFRLGGRADRLRKVSLHEIGHLMNLPHCTSGQPTCLMQDARGRAATVDRTREQLCADCRNRLDW